jgi:hypothetical protein
MQTEMDNKKSELKFKEGDQWDDTEQNSSTSYQKASGSDRRDRKKKGLWEDRNDWNIVIIY